MIEMPFSDFWHKKKTPSGSEY